MSITIKGGKRKRVYVKTGVLLNGENFLIFGDYEIPLEEFLYAAEYVLTNTDLKRGDPRLKFRRCVRSMVKTDGFNKGGKRLMPRIAFP